MPIDVLAHRRNRRHVVDSTLKHKKGIAKVVPSDGMSSRSTASRK